MSRIITFETNEEVSRVLKALSKLQINELGIYAKEMTDEEKLLDV